MDGLIIGHGHIGDGNLHLNCVLKGFNNKDLLKIVNDKIQPFVFNYIKNVRGSVSAEHGIGL
jgi:FAD/FMN-containing dehydrogenase